MGRGRAEGGSSRADDEHDTPRLASIGLAGKRVIGEGTRSGRIQLARCFRAKPVSDLRNPISDA
jgi:hypothetical protein